MQISGKTFVVTGGASGLGRASVEAILAAGGNAVILDVNAEAGKAAEQALGAKARFALADVTSEEQVKAAEAAKDGCPISGAIKGNVELSVKASLA